MMDFKETNVKLFTYLGVILYFTGGVIGVRIPEVQIDQSVAVSPRKIFLSWTPEFVPKRGSLEYVVRYKTKGTVGSHRETFLKPETTLKGLEPAATYVINVRAVNGKSRGGWSENVLVDTPSRKKDSSNNELSEDVVYIDDVTHDGATLILNITKYEIDESNFRAFQIVIKGRNHREEMMTTSYELKVTGLKSEMKYAVNVFIVDKNGEKGRLGSAKFKTLQEPIEPPGNVRLKSATNTSISIKWKRLDGVDGYMVQYKTDFMSTSCSVEISNVTKWYRVKDLLPGTAYSLRVAGIQEDRLGHFSTWVNVSTLPHVTNYDGISVFNISPHDVLVRWTMPDTSYDWNIQVFDSRRNVTILESIGSEQDDQSEESTLLLSDLAPNSPYKIVLTSEEACPVYKVSLFTTASDDYIEKNVKLSEFDAKLRLFQLPDKSYFLTWTSPKTSLENATYITVIRILGEPFLHPVSTHVIPAGQHYLHVTNINTRKTYSMDLMMFTSVNGSQPEIFQKIVVTPRDEVYPDIISYGTSMDMCWTDDVTDDVMNGWRSDDYVLHEIPDTNFTVLSRTGHVVNESRWPFPSQVSPSVIRKTNVTVTVGTSLDITCVTRGDFFPTITWHSASKHDTITEFSTANRSILITSVRHVGINSDTGATFMYKKSFLTINPVLFEDEQMYECVGTNSVGSDKAAFALIVHPKRPGPVQHISASTTPFQVYLTWAEPIEESRDQRGVVTFYHLTLTDEYQYTLREQNVTDTKAVFKDLQPSSKYHVTIRAFNSIEGGVKNSVTIETLSIPVLGPPINVTVTTLNGTTMQISWLPPKHVQTQHIKLRAFVFHHRKHGQNTQNTVEEMQIGSFTNISMIELEADQKYEVQVVALSEDGQMSHSSWVLGNTSREAYMNESVPPPPPHNVYLRHVEGNIIVSWLPPHPDENILLRGYIIDVYNNKSKREAMTVGHKESSVIIYEVQMGVNYEISVRATNNAGSSIEEWAELYVPNQYVTQEPVQNFRAVALSSTKLELQWDPPTSGLYNRFVMSYTLTDDVRPDPPGGGNLPSSVRNYVVRSLEPYTEYVFNITPYWRNLRGNTVNTTVRTLSDKPTSPPYNVTLTSINSTTILVRCMPPEAGKNGLIRQYRIAYRDENERGSALVNADDSEELNHYLTDLQPMNVYEMRVRSLTINGSGPWSLWFQSKTKSKEPVMPKLPRNLTTSATAHTITLSWLPPEQPINDIAGYVVGYGRFMPEVFRYSLTTADNEYTFTNLQVGSIYIVSVRSFNDFGESAAVFQLLSTL